MNTSRLTEEGLKNKAKKIRQFILEKHDLKIPHGHCLDLVSKIYDFKDWNTASAMLSGVPQKTDPEEKIDTIGKFRQLTAHLSDDAHLSADFTLDIIDLISELEEGQSATNFTFSLSSIEIHGDDDFATLALGVDYEDCEFDSRSGITVEESMYRHLGINIKK